MSENMLYFPVFTGGVLGNNYAVMKSRDAIFDSEEEAREEAEGLLTYMDVRLPIFFSGEVHSIQEGEGIEGADMEGMALLIIKGPALDNIEE